MSAELFYTSAAHTIDVQAHYGGTPEEIAIALARQLIEATDEDHWSIEAGDVFVKTLIRRLT